MPDTCAASFDNLQTVPKTTGSEQWQSALPLCSMMRSETGQRKCSFGSQQQDEIGGVCHIVEAGDIWQTATAKR